MLLWSFLGFLALLWLAKMQRDYARGQEARRQRQRRQRVGLKPLAGSAKPEDLDAEEARLLAVLRERQGKGES